MKHTHDYDNVFKTMKHRHKRLFISVINETFGKNYPLDSAIEVLPSEGYHIIVDDAEEYLHFLQDLFPYFEKYKADEQLQKLIDRIEYIMNEFHIATPCDRALLLDYKAELLLEDGKSEKALKKRKRAIEIMEKEYAQTIDQRTVSLLSNLYNNVGTICQDSSAQAVML